MNPLNIILTVLLFLSGALTVLEKNLNRLTVITATVFIVSILVMALTFPTGTLG